MNFIKFDLEIFILLSPPDLDVQNPLKVIFLQMVDMPIVQIKFSSKDV